LGRLFALCDSFFVTFVIGFDYLFGSIDSSHTNQTERMSAQRGSNSIQVTYIRAPRHEDPPPNDSDEEHLTEEELVTMIEEERAKNAEAKKVISSLLSKVCKVENV
jgi:hypothetical protein